MKKHNDNYSGRSVSIKVVKNGFVVTTSSENYVFKSYLEVVQFIARDFGLTAIGEVEKIRFSNIDDEMEKAVKHNNEEFKKEEIKFITLDQAKNLGPSTSTALYMIQQTENPWHKDSSVVITTSPSGFFQGYGDQLNQDSATTTISDFNVTLPTTPSSSANPTDEYIVQKSHAVQELVDMGYDEDDISK